MDKAPSQQSSKFQIIGSALLALYAILFLWDFFSSGVYALGVNMAVGVGAFYMLLISTLSPEQKKMSIIWKWGIPLALIALSYLLYENPFMKIAHVIVLPVLITVFWNIETPSTVTPIRWSLDVAVNAIGRFFDIFRSLSPALDDYARSLGERRSHASKLKKIVIGIVLFLILALFFIIPLLMSADPAFGEQIKAVFDWITAYVSVETLLKIVSFCFLAIFVLGTLIAWRSPMPATGPQKAEKQIDSIVSGTVLVGILALYILFLWLQLERLWVHELPFVFEETEALVKGGFWELIVLSLINIIIFLICYGRTSKAAQRILGLFTAASLLLVASAAHRMWLYVTYYGFSYEKFYAFYAVIFCVVLFVWLVSRFFVSHRSDVMKFVAYQFLWMYAVVSILPIEQFVLRANVALAQHADTRIHLYELRMLSADVLQLVEKYDSAGMLMNEQVIQQKTDEEMKYVLQVMERERKHGVLNSDVPISLPDGTPATPQSENRIYYAENELIEFMLNEDPATIRTRIENTIRARYDWKSWIIKTQKELDQKPWYQRTLSGLMNAR